MNISNQPQKAINKWYRLDNAANLYPAIRGRKRPGVFRVSAELNNQINPDQLQQALNNTLKRIPGFSVKLRAGLFWHYFIHSDKEILIQEDVSNPCTEMTTKSTRDFLIRIRFHQKSIALEAFHSITDGSGAMVFLKTLIAQYLRLQGIQIPPTEGVLDCSHSPSEKETSDLFDAFAHNSPTRKLPKTRAYHIKGTQLAPGRMHITNGTITTQSLKQAAKSKKVTITEYLAAVFLMVLNDTQLSQYSGLKLPVKIQVPVNLRQFSTGQTLRNFSAFVTPSIDPSRGKYTFEEIIDMVHHFLHYESTEKHLQAQVAENIRYASNPIIRLLPLFFKNKLIYLGYKLMGPSSFTSILSNLGLIKVPDEMREHVKSFGLILGATRSTNISCGVLGYRGNVVITFSRVIHESEVERRFFTFLVEQGIPVHVDVYQE